MVGYLDPKFMAVADQLEGRLCQVTDIFSNSTSPDRKRLSEEHKGVCLMTIVDSYRNGDDKINELYDYPDSEEEEDENSE